MNENLGTILFMFVIGAPLGFFIGGIKGLLFVASLCGILLLGLVLTVGLAGVFGGKGAAVLVIFGVPILLAVIFAQDELRRLLSKHGNPGRAKREQPPHE